MPTSRLLFMDTAWERCWRLRWRAYCGAKAPHVRCTCLFPDAPRRRSRAASAKSSPICPRMSCWKISGRREGSPRRSLNARKWSRPCFQCCGRTSAWWNVFLPRRPAVELSHFRLCGNRNTIEKKDVEAWSSLDDLHVFLRGISRRTLFYPEFGTLVAGSIRKRAEPVHWKKHWSF